MGCQNAHCYGRSSKAARRIYQRPHESGVEKSRILSELAAPSQLQFSAAFRRRSDLKSEPFMNADVLEIARNFVSAVSASITTAPSSIGAAY